MAEKEPKKAVRGKGKVGTEVKECILEAFTSYVGQNGSSGGVAYLQLQMDSNPTAFMTLLGKVIPKDVNNNHSGTLAIVDGEFVIHDPKG